jgi:hypothetical protein
MDEKPEYLRSPRDGHIIEQNLTKIRLSSQLSREIQVVKRRIDTRRSSIGSIARDAIIVDVVSYFSWDGAWWRSRTAATFR